MTQKIALIIGAGAKRGLGAAIASKAAAEGRYVIVAARRQDAVDALARSISDAGGQARGMTVDVTDEAQVQALFSQIDEIDGALDLVAYNAGNAFTHDTLTISSDYFTSAWQVCCLGGFLCGREAGKRMKAQNAGTLVYTGATASLRARPPFMAFASAKAGLRAVAATFARELGPDGVHVAHVIIDGGIDGERLNSRNPTLKDRMGENGMLDPDAIASSYWQIHLQHPSAWTFEADLRPFKETF
ncbi:MAG: SDR family NAD(P)-dependent oxidoreductase [Pseudomonadota bacterium]